MKTRHAILALVALATTACGAGETTEGITVDVEVEGAGRTSFTTASGHDVVLDQAWVTTSSVEIFACRSDELGMTVTPLWRRALRALDPVPPAHAHSEGSSTFLGVPVVADMATETSLHAGTLEPPPGSYCRVAVTVSPADADALGLEANQSMLGLSVEIVGQIDPEGAAQAIELRDAPRLTASVELTEPLVLDAGNRTATIVVSHDPQTWFVNADPASESLADDIAAAVGDEAVVEVAR